MPSGQMTTAATLRGQSQLPELCFTETVLVYGEALENVHRLQRHGVIVVSVSNGWKYDYHRQGGWLQFIFDEAFRLIRALPPVEEIEGSMQGGYDQKLADQILVLLNKIYPASLPLTDGSKTPARKPAYRSDTDDCTRCTARR